MLEVVEVMRIDYSERVIYTIVREASPEQAEATQPTGVEKIAA